MFETTLIYTLIRTLPESIIIMLSGMILINVKVYKNDLFKKGIFLGIIIGCIRMLLPINFGVHTILSMIVIEMMFFKISKKDIVKSTIATCCVWISLALSEGIYVLITNGIIGVPIETLMDQSIKGAMITLPSLLITLGIVVILKKINIKTKGFNLGN